MIRSPKCFILGSPLHLNPVAMKRRSKILPVCLILVGFVLLPQVAAAQLTLSTTFAAGNNHRGNMFDLVAINQVTIQSFDVHPQGDTNIEVYYKTGTHVGFETNAGAWTLVGDADVVAQPQGTPTPVPLSINVSIDVGETYAFYVTSSNVAVSLNYSNGSTRGNVFASDANLQFLEGTGLEYPYANGGGLFIPRVWNGVIHYRLGPLPVELTAFDALSDDGGVVLSWETATETNNAGFEVQIQNPDAEHWQTLTFVGGAGTTTEAQRYSYRNKDLAPGRYRFRLKQVDYNGAFVYSQEVEATMELPGTHLLSAAYPNPFNPQTQFTLTVAREQQVHVEIYDDTGRHVRTLNQGRLSANVPHLFTFSAGNSPPGLYLYRVKGEVFSESRAMLLIR